MKITLTSVWKKWIDSKKRLKISYGGRSGGKTFAIAIILLIIASQKKTKVLCCREFQASLDDSVYSSFKEICENVTLFADFFHFTRNKIIGANGSEFLFKGLQNPDSLKSIPKIDIVWLEEGQSVSFMSYKKLEATVRPSAFAKEDNCQIWVSMNPDTKEDVFYKEIMNAHDNTHILKVNYNDNPFCPQSMIDLAEKEKLDDYDSYKHIWLGEPISDGEVLVYANKWAVQEFEPYIDADKGLLEFEGAYKKIRYGIDIGGTSPTVVLENFIHDNCLYIHNEIYKRNLSREELTELMIDEMPLCLSPASSITGDNNNVEFIEGMRKSRRVDGKHYPALKIKTAMKGQGSVMMGIKYVKSFKRIIVHPRCINTIKELKHYSYKLNQKTGEVVHDTLVKKYDHAMDAMRYSVEDGYYGKKMQRFDTATYVDILKNTSD